jgi:hypothetical protein
VLQKNISMGPKGVGGAQWLWLLYTTSFLRASFFPYLLSWLN